MHVIGITCASFFIYLEIGVQLCKGTIQINTQRRSILLSLF
jgi:hypothetical protein